MNKLAAYLKERHGFDSVVTEDGFCAYRFNGDECFIYDIYVSPAYRKKSLGSQLAMEVERLAKIEGCKFLSGSVCLKALNAQDSINFILAYGLTEHARNPDYVTFRKEL